MQTEVILFKILLIFRWGKIKKIKFQGEKKGERKKRENCIKTGVFFFYIFINIYGKEKS